MKYANLLLFFLLVALTVGCTSEDSQADEPPDLQESSVSERNVTTADSTVVDSAGSTPATEGSETTGAGTTRSVAGTVPAPEFPGGLDWLNTAEPLSLADLRGKIVLLDFWTYGCINCLHVIPDLKRLEEKYAEELVVIGVHSAKFENEGDTENIRQIIQRYELAHPVVNDKNFAIWNRYGARAWPTFVLIDPQGNVVGYHSGEGIYDLFDQVIGQVVLEFGEEIDRSPLELVLERESLANSPLLFPGKVLADEAGERLFIADSNHNRIVVTDLEGRVLEVIGSGQEGLVDGGYETARFFRPHGLALADEQTLYVADMENHAIRRINLAARTVETAAGTGEQNYIRVSEGAALATPLNSPWDVLYHNGLLYIAMAGQHQLWSYEPDTETVRVFAGSGREELRDGTLLQAGLNQPSGLATDGEWLYVADSEASAIRAAYLGSDDAVLTTLVGTGLFDFGDSDGVGDEVQLQHPLGLVYYEGLLYVADTYNDKIKTLNPETQEVLTFAGSGRAGWRDGEKPFFAEPGGVSVAENQLYIADTNNHVVRVLDLESRNTSTLVLIDEEGLLTRQPADEYTGRVVTLEEETIGAGEGEIRLDVILPEGFKVNDLAPASFIWTSLDGIVTLDEADASQRIVAPDFPLFIPAAFAVGETVLTGDLAIYYCEDEAQSLCLIEQVRLVVPVAVVAEGAEELSLSHTIPQPPAP